MFRMPFFAGACLALVSLPVVTQAAPAVSPSPLPVDTPAPSEIGSVTTAGDRHRELTVQSAKPVYIITADEIRRRGTQTIAEALAQVPGVVVMPYGGIGQLTDLRLPGSNETNDVLILVNGFPIQNAYSGSVDLGTITTAGISRIEILEGGASALYGSSASVGVINIVMGGDDRPYAALSTGSFATNRMVAADSFRLSNGSALHAAFEQENAANSYPYVASTSGSGFPAGTRRNAYGQLSTGLLTYTGNLRAAWQVNGLAYLDSEHNGVPNSLPTTDFTGSQAASRQLFGASLEHAAGRVQTTLTLSNSRDTLLFSDPFIGLSTSSTNVDRSDISLRNLLEMHQSRILFGAETSQASVGAGQTGTFSSNVAARRSESALFTQYEYDIAKTGRAYAGLRYEHDSPQGHTLAPAVGAVVPIGSLRLSGNASTAFRVPTLVELYYPNFGNITLQPERSRNANLMLSAPDIGGGVSVSAFTRTASNLIQSLPTAPFTASNIAHASIQGFVVSAKTKPFHHLVLSAGYTDTYRADDTTTSTPTRLLYMPQSVTTFALERQPDGNALSWGITGEISSPSLQYNGTSPEWSALNAYLRVPLSPGAALTFRSKNVTNEAYEVQTGYPMPSRSYEVELATR